MKQLFRNPTFLKLFMATIASQLGTVVGNMAFAYYLVDRFSERPSLAATAELMYSLPALAVFWIVGVFADRFDRKSIAIYSDWIRAGLTVLLLVFVHYDLIFLCFVILFLRSAISKFFGPAEMGLLQGSIQHDQYVQASGLNQIVMSLFMLFGMSLGAIAYHFLGIEGALILDGISFVVSGLLFILADFPEHARMPNGRNRLRDLQLRVFFTDFLHGLRYIVQHKLLLFLISGFMFFGVMNGVFAVLPIFAMKYKLSPDHYVVYSSMVTVFLGIGFLIGSLIGPKLIARFTRTPVLIAGLFAVSVLLLILGLTNTVQIYLSVVLLAGIILAPVNISLGSWMPQLVPPQNIGRVNALIEPVMMLGHSASLGLVALAFPAWIAVSGLHYLLAGCLLILSFFYCFSLPPLVRRLNASSAYAEEAADPAPAAHL
ncbi:MFS transporter [Saccharibacillus sp. O16]|nr:MFS transporter [Saccharibacillus sp. O16]